MPIDFPPIEEGISAPVDGEDSRFIHLLHNILAKKKLFFALFIGAVLFATALSSLFFVLGKRREKGDQIEKEFMERSKESLIDFYEKSLKSYPELERKVGNQVAQQVIQTKRVEQDIAIQGLARMGFVHSFHKEFAGHSILVAKGDLAEAFLGAKKLHQKMSKEKSWESKEGAILFGFNLVRLALLSFQLGEEDGDLLEEIDLYFGKDSPLGEKRASRLFSHFSKEGVDLKDYLQSLSQRS